MERIPQGSLNGVAKRIERALRERTEEFAVKKHGALILRPGAFRFLSGFVLSAQKESERRMYEAL